MVNSSSVDFADVFFGLWNGDRRVEDGEDAAEDRDRALNALFGDEPEDAAELYSGGILSWVATSNNVTFGIGVEPVVDSALRYDLDTSGYTLPELFGDNTLPELFGDKAIKELARLGWMEYERSRRIGGRAINRSEWFDIVQLRIAFEVEYHFDSGYDDPGDEWFEYNVLGALDLGSYIATDVGLTIEYMKPGALADACPLYKGE